MRIATTYLRVLSDFSAVLPEVSEVGLIQFISTSASCILVFFLGSSPLLLNQAVMYHRGYEECCDGRRVYYLRPLSFEEWRLVILSQYQLEVSNTKKRLLCK